MRLGIDPKVDIAFKMVFGSEEEAPVLIDLLHAVVQPTRPITGLEIAPAHSAKDTPLDKLAIGDVRARDQGNRQFHVEMQWQAAWFFPKRLLYYWAKFHPQLREGENYQTLRPTISICFVNQTLFADMADHHMVFRLREAKRDLVFSDDLEIHLIELPKFTKSAEQLSSALDRWCYFLRHGAELDLEHLPASLDVPMIRRAMEVLTVFSQDERERELYEQRVKFQRDQSSLLQEVRDAHEAEEQARKDADRGRKEGLMGQIHLCQELLKQPRTPESELLALSQEDLTTLVAQLRKQLLPNGA
jgi:predicted transposase/invertase (TIGR01784 family)